MDDERWTIPNPPKTHPLVKTWRAVRKVLLLWSVIATLLWLRIIPSPVPDFGGRHIAVANEAGYRAVVRICEEVGRLRLVQEIISGPTKQAMFNDGTVVILIDDEFRRKIGISGNGPSFPVANRVRALLDIQEILQEEGFPPKAEDVFDVDTTIGVVAVKTPALLNAEIALRPHILTILWRQTRQRIFG